MENDRAELCKKGGNRTPSQGAGGRVRGARGRVVARMIGGGMTGRTTTRPQTPSGRVGHALDDERGIGPLRELEPETQLLPTAVKLRAFAGRRHAPGSV